MNAVRPGLATTRGPLIIASSPYAKRGVLWDAHRKHYGKDGDPLVLVAQGHRATSTQASRSRSSTAPSHAITPPHPPNISPNSATT